MSAADRKKIAARIKAARRRQKNTSEELAGYEGLLKLAMDDMRRIYEDMLKAQSQAQQADKLATIGLLAAGIIHEINNPITVVQGTVQVIAKHMEAMAEARAAIDKVRKAVLEDRDLAGAESALRELEALDKKINTALIMQAVPELVESSIKGLRHATRITGALKTFSRSSHGEIAPASLNKILDDVVDIVWSQVKYSAKLQKEYGEVPPIPCNQNELCQVFMNLLINASHAMTKGGTITLRTFVEGERACAEVSDTGTGIPPEVLPKIFEPFFTTKEAGKGTGLGLSISTDIVKKHNGEIKVRSRVGEGTAFTVCLPLKR